MIWFALYVAAMFCIALPVAWFGKNQVAGTVFIVWGVGQVAHEIGLPEPVVQVILYGGALALLVILRARRKLDVSDGSLVAIALFMPLLLVACLWMCGKATKDEVWWPIWIIAMIQAVFLIRPIAWPRALVRWFAAKSTARNGGSFMVRA